MPQNTKEIKLETRITPNTSHFAHVCIHLR